MIHRGKAIYYPALDGMRGVGIVFVVVYHFLLLSDYSWSTIGFSWVWIQMFFIQSGFLITQMLLDDREAPLGRYLGRFYWRRILRIFPVYFGYLLIPTVLYLALGIPEALPERLPYLVTFTFNFADLAREIVKVNLWFIHFWSLSVEEQFYLVWPFLVFFIAPRRLRVLLIAIVIAAPLFRWWQVSHLLAAGATEELAGRMAYSNTLCQLDAFAFGAAIPLFKLTDRVQRPGRWATSALAVALAAGAANFLLLRGAGVELSWTSLGFSGGLIGNFQHVWSYTLVNLLFLFVVLRAIQPEQRGLFGHPVAVRLGKVSYGMYVVHMAVLIAFDRLNERYVGSVAAMTIVGLVASYLVAELSYRYYERRFLALKDSPPRWLVSRVKA